MKITSVDVMALEQDPDSKNRPIICRVNTDEGIYGYGEAAIAIGTGANAAYELIKDLAPMIIGRDPFDNEVIWEKLFKSSFWAQGNGAIELSAISAIDIALWDIKGKALNLPLYKLLGGKQRESLRCYASQIQFGWATETFNPLKAPSGAPEFYAQAARKAVDQGYTAVKANFMRFDENGDMLSHEAATGYLSKKMMTLVEERMKAVRDEVGYDIDLIVENHAMTDAATGLQIAKLCEKYDVMFLEEPTMPLNPKVFEKIQHQTSVPLATGERSYTRWGFQPFIDNQSLTVIQPDIGNCGGLTEAKKICDMAHIYDLSVQMHVCSSPLSVAISLHLETAIPNFMIHEHHITNTTPFNIAQCRYDYQPVDGYITAPDLPGIGQEISDEALSKARIETIS
ncbi:galactonate dehydratase [Lactococcus hodotermopsidis]|uniref:Galactonate dehydratase n=1 Tax=Pseudolactococcus hodotermopsidis TaxID=2709157 RepID=A0A6A0BFP3_9LACT|nr:mandelate racemase/muconate lactonizing enzyme family protein [Lactococcus hodotermopsidis]GFH42647.1 galactonate dehydratase [Lactococcus hodotermopsidis]